MIGRKKIDCSFAEEFGQGPYCNDDDPPKVKVDEGMRRLAESLSRAHIKYFHLFGKEPHGTIQQMMAVLELCPEAKEYIRLYERQRTDMLTR